MRFLAEGEPERGVALPVGKGVRRVVANNPGVMTYRGTNSYLIGWDDGAAVVDPGPEDDGHVRTLVEVAGGPVRAILLTHGHRDHRGAVAALRAATRARFYAFDAGLGPDVVVRDGDQVGGWRVLHTPGHAADHVCFVRDGVVLSGDHVMSWSSTVVAGPGSDMGAYFASLERLISVPAEVYLPGHGPPLPEPVAFAAELLEHRRMRERMLLEALGQGERGLGALVGRLYPGLDRALAGAAEGNVRAHLAKLVAEGRIVATEEGWMLAAQG